MSTQTIIRVGAVILLSAIAFPSNEVFAQQDFVRSMATIFRQIVPPETKCYFGVMNGNAICEYSVTNGNNFDTLRLEAGQFDMPLRNRSIELTQTTTNRNSPVGMQQMQIIKDFAARYNFTYDQLVSCMRAGIQGFWQGMTPSGVGGGAVTVGNMTMNCKVNIHAPTESGGTTTIDLRPSKGPNDF